MIYPRHIAIVMDGNGRWASKRCLPRIAGHRAGLTAVHRTIQACVDKRVEVLSLFAFSSENWNRPAKEVTFLMDLLLSTLDKEIKRIHDNNIRLLIIGNKLELSTRLQQAIESAEQLTATNTGMTLVVAVNYGGTWDVVNAVRKLAIKVAEKQLVPQAIDEVMLWQMLTTADLPAPDLFIRTSGEQRLSNFFLLQAAYAELYFTPVLWPDFTLSDLQAAIDDFNLRQRRYGGLQATEVEIASSA